jgi:hypothetical protein
MTSFRQIEANRLPDNLPDDWPQLTGTGPMRSEVCFLGIRGAKL